MTPASSRSTALIATGVLALFVVIGIAVTTPWQPLSGPSARPDPTRDFTQPEIARAGGYVHATMAPAVLSTVVGLLVALALGLTPAGARLASAVGDRLPQWWPLRVAAGVVALLVAVTVVTLPFGAWRQVVARRYGLSVQSWGAWAVDQLRGFAVQAVLVVLLLVALVGLARALPRWWWAVGAALAAVAVVALSFAGPALIEPLFNKFTPLPAGDLRTSLLAMAAADGVTVSDVLVADASRRTTSLNAYVSGFGGTRRIVVYDTLLERPDDEVRLVVAHELGHAAEGDVLHGTLLGAAGAATSVCLLGFCLSLPALLRRAQVEGAGDPRAVALVLATFAVVAAVTGPVQSLVSRRIEARADVHSLDVTRDPALFTRAMRQLALTNLANPYPNPVLYVLFADHPSIPERLALARAWAVQHRVAVPPDLAASAVAG